MTEIERLWKDTLEALRDTVPSSQYEVWIAPLKPLRVDGEGLALGVGHELQRTYVTRHFLGAIEAAAARVAGRPVAIRFELAAGGQGELFGPGPAPAAATTSPALPAGAGRLRNRGEHGGLPLNPRYRFENFVVGNNNRFAHAAACGVADKPGRGVNPLFLYGGVGLGKTHLLHAIGHEVKARHPGKRVVYTTMEKFTNDMIRAIREQNTVELRRKYRHTDLLLIDDIQFLQGKESTQDEFFHTINDLMAGERQIVATSDTHPKDIRVEERLKSRFQGGLVADLQAPDFETRLAILKQKTDAEHPGIPEDVLAVIAEIVQSNIRELEGALNRVIAIGSLTGRDLTADLAREALRDLAVAPRPPRTIDRVQQAVARHFSIEPQLLCEKTRTEAVVYPRQLAMYLCHELLGSSSTAIGQQFGGRDHSTVLHAIDKIRRLLASDPPTREHLEQIRRALDA